MTNTDTAVDVQFDSRGLVPVVTQDADSGQVLMLAFASADAISRTLETGLAHYYSRSREELWQKGATSGHVQRIDDVRIDCDGDSVLYSVSQEGGACHTGYETCFYRSVDGVSIDSGTSGNGDGDADGSETDRARTNETNDLTVETRVVADHVFDPDAVY